MTNTPSHIGTIGWLDLTVADAENIRVFYSSVVGWAAEPVDMNGYNDFNMKPPNSNEPVAGVCHKRDANENLPAVWMVYFLVEDVDASIANVTKLGGEVIAGPTGSDANRFAIIKDPAGAVCALYQAPS